MQPKQHPGHPEPVSGSYHNKEILKLAVLVQNDRCTDSGRSMVEMLGMLAIMGLLGIAAIYGIQMAMNKTKANQIIKDGRLAHTSLITDPMASESPWQDAGFTPLSDKTIQKCINANQQPLVKVQDVQPSVCKELLQYTGMGEVKFYNAVAGNTCSASANELTTCGDQNQDIVILFDANGMSDESGDDTGCRTAADCDNGWCNNGECVPCPDYQQPNEQGDGCTANCKQETQDRCGIGEGDDAIDWCCDKELQCGSEPGTCSDGTCSWEFHQFAPKATCQWTFEQKAPHSDCTVTLTYNAGGTEVTDVTTTGCADSGEYCYVAYTDADCDATNHAVQNGSTGTLHGVCNAMTTVNTTCVPELTYTSSGCDTAGQYCYLYYTDQGCSTPAGNSATTLYGVCQGMTTVNTTCVPEITMEEKTYCQSGEYWYLKWATNTACTELTNGASDVLYGTCIAQNAASGSCPYNH